jgi:hypothetical protein
MSADQRKVLIKTLENRLGAKVLTLVTGDRQGMETRIAPDILSLVSEHLASIGSTEKLALFIYTPGGDTIVGWGLVNLLRQYCKRLEVLVPFRALSCGTLIALGADSIVMGKHGLLSPVDPSVSSPFNPSAPGQSVPGMVSLLPVSVEDMVGFLDLAKHELGLRSEESRTALLRMLADKVHPLALGAVYRAREQTASLAKRLLLTHSDDGRRIDRITSRLTIELPTHNYLIGRAEAVEIQLAVSEPTQEVDGIMWSLYKEYEDWLKFTSPFSAELDLGTEQRKRVLYERAAVESLSEDTLKQHVFVTDNDIIRNPASPENVGVRTLFMGWVASKNGEAFVWR